MFQRSPFFVKAFSDSPRAFCDHLGSLQRACSALRVSKVIFLPRYHQEIVSELDSVPVKPHLIELAVTLSPAMRACQQGLVELIQVIKPLCKMVAA